MSPCTSGKTPAQFHCLGGNQFDQVCITRITSRASIGPSADLQRPARERRKILPPTAKLSATKHNRRTTASRNQASLEKHREFQDDPQSIEHRHRSRRGSCRVRLDGTVLALNRHGHRRHSERSLSGAGTALAIGSVISFAGMAMASQVGEPAALRLHAAEPMLMLGTAIVMLVERPAQPQADVAPARLSLQQT